MERRFDLLALGEGMVEFNLTRPGEPPPGAEPPQAGRAPLGGRAQPVGGSCWLQGFGGDTSNAVIAAARAGARTAYLSRVGDDTFGRDLLGLWVREGVDTSAVETDPEAPTGIYFVTHGPAGHEFSYRRAGSAASRMTPHWLHGAPAAAIRQARILHVSGISLAISPSACETALAAMHLARAAGVQVAFDSNLRLKLWPIEAARPAMAQALRSCDIFLPSLEDMAALNGITDPQAVLDWGHAGGARIVVLKLGERGAWASDGERCEHIAPLRVPAVDATGAGDCFAGNFLARLAAGDAVFQAARYANAAAALAVQGYGAVAPLPRPQQVLALL